jgi:hypothetical protein
MNNMKQIKVINRIPSPADQIDKEVDKLFNSKLNKFLGYSFPLLCGLGWILILLAIFSS